jgi:hypothetical protein
LKLRATDGDVGSLRDLIFHDTDWSIRELIADTGGWLFGRRIRLDPDSVLEPDIVAGALPLELTKDQVKNSPDATKPAPSDPQSEDIIAWNKSNAVAAIPENLLLAGAALPVQPLAAVPDSGNLHLRSLEEMTGYEVWAGDHHTGTLTGFLVDPIAWDLPLALVQIDGGDEAPVVLLPTRLIAGLGWPDRVARTYLNASVLRSAPVYDARVLDERVYLPAVADYYSTRV